MWKICKIKNRRPREIRQNREIVWNIFFFFFNEKNHDNQKILFNKKLCKNLIKERLVILTNVSSVTKYIHDV